MVPAAAPREANVITVPRPIPSHPLGVRGGQGTPGGHQLTLAPEMQEDFQLFLVWMKENTKKKRMKKKTIKKKVVTEASSKEQEDISHEVHEGVDESSEKAAEPREAQDLSYEKVFNVQKKRN